MFEFYLYQPPDADISEDVIILVCVAKFNFNRSRSKDKTDFYENRDECLSYLRDFGGVYLSGNVTSHPYDKQQKITVFEYELIVKDNSLMEYFKKITNKSFINQQSMELAMAKQAAAPYKMWSIQALQNECKQRKFDPAQYQSVTDKNVLVKLLEMNDASKTTAPSAPAAKPVAAKSAAPKPAAAAPKPAAKPVATPAAAKPVAKPVEKAATKPAATKTDKAEAAKKISQSATQLNEQLRAAGLWVSGCQFLAADQKQALLNAKTDAERKKIYTALEQKKIDIAGVLSEKMKAKAAEKAAAVPEETEPEAAEEAEPVVEEAEPEAEVVEEPVAPPKPTAPKPGVKPTPKPGVKPVAKK